MKYLLLLILIGIAIYYATNWQKSSNKKSGGGKSNGNPYDGNSNTSTDNGPYAKQKNGGQRQASSINYTKWVAGGLGWAFGGPIGGLLGFMFGSMVGGNGMTNGQIGQTRTGDFNVSLLILTAAVMKADGKVTKSELDYVKKFISNNFGAARAPEYVKILGELIKKDFNLQDVSYQIKQYMDYSSRLMILQFLFGIALSDGKSHENEMNVIETIASYLGITNNDYASIKAMFIKDTNSAYQILEISPDATNDELKKAYRELAKKYHPDKVSHLGEEIKKAAEVKITELNAAYDAVKEERGIS
ncbi:MAG: TerB family tellurite resistance protein [Bacteroidota bacterium]